MIKKLSILLAVVVLSSVVFISGCKKKEDATTTKPIITPTAFNIDVPSSINNETKSITPIKGEDIYQNLRTFIHVGDFSAKFVKGIIVGLSTHKITDVIKLTYTDATDKRVKTLEVTKTPTFEGKSYEWKLTIMDGTELGFEMFWNVKPISGIAIMKPFVMNKTTKTVDANLMYRVDYAEGVEGYEKRMEVSVSDLGMASVDRWAMNNMKMYVGKKGDNLELWGNTNHPRAMFLDSTNADGISYAFVGRSDQIKNIAVAKVSVPSGSMATVAQIFDNYNAYTLLKTYLQKYNIPNDTIEKFLVNTKLPGYFTAKGFVSCEKIIPTAPIVGFTPAFIDLSALKPYIPKEIKDLKVKF